MKLICFCFILSLVIKKNGFCIITRKDFLMARHGWENKTSTETILSSLEDYGVHLIKQECFDILWILLK